WSLPHNGRILIYFLYLGISLFVYHVLKDSTLFSEEDSLIITLLFSTVPVNEARLLISNFPYTVGLFLFYLGFMLFVNWNKSKKCAGKTICRILLLFLFFISFILSSVLAYYYIIIAYLFVLQLKSSSETGWFRRILQAVINVVRYYFDFCILPFVYFILHKMFFPVSEIFAGRSSVSIEGLKSCLDYMPWSVIKVFRDICRRFLSCINPVMLIMLLIVSVFLFLARTELEDHALSDSVKYLIYGMTALVLALFPYIVIRQDLIETIGVKGRDAILIPLGFALILYAALSLIKGKYRSLLAGIVLVFSIFSCNALYLEWQKDYYAQLALEEKLNEPVIAANDTFFLTDLHETQVEGQRYYSLNANAYHVYGEKTRLFLPKASNLNLLLSKKALLEAQALFDHAYLFEDYDPEDYCLDAVLDFDCEFTDAETWKLKYLEIFDPDGFKELIRQSGSLDVYTVDDDFTILLLDAYKKNALHEDEDVLELLYDYIK
ncbi:MAG: hypothetical protein IJL85_04220, partial [Erysipelotrichaceae bacterium]|nr:hypothetical protein [Erysipelotrichaceae bacterium]